MDHVKALESFARQRTPGRGTPKPGLGGAPARPPMGQGLAGSRDRPAGPQLCLTVGLTYL